MVSNLDDLAKLMELDKGGMLEAKAKGHGKLARMFSILLLGDYVSTYLALLYGHDTSSMDVIDELKRE